MKNNQSKSFSTKKKKSDSDSIEPCAENESANDYFSSLRYQLVVLLLAATFGSVLAQVATPVTLTPATTSYDPPAGITRVTVEIWGAGGSGGGNSNGSNGGSGGGGGAYAKDIITGLSHGTAVNVQIGAGPAGNAGADGTAGQDTFWKNAGTLNANGGAKGNAGTAGAGGAVAAGGAAGVSGTVHFDGGDGGVGRTSGTGRGGPGGSSAGTGAIGTSGPTVWSTVTASAAPAGGGIGGNGGATASDGLPGTIPGGGGGGAGDMGASNVIGGAGADGQMIVTYVQASSAASYTKNSVRTGDAQTVQLIFSEVLTGTPKITLTGSSSGAIFTNQNMTLSSGSTWTFNAGTTAWTAALETVTITVNTATGSVAGIGNVVFPSPSSSTFTVDNTPPTKPGDPTAAAGPDINAAENGTFTILVPGINTTGAVAGDAITIFQGASVLATHALSAGEVAGTATFLNVTLTGADGLKSITAKVTDQAGNVGPANTTALSLNLDTTFPTKPGDPTAAAGPDINAAENGTFTILVPGINTTGAVAGDAITIFQGASVLATHVLSAGEVAGTATFLNVTLTGADGLKSITAKVTDIAGNVGPANTTALSLNLDTTFPTKPGDPTAAAGPDINAAENGTFTILVPGINTTGAVTGDAITIFQGASVLATHALSAGEVAGTATFLNITLTGADGLKSITAKVTDIAGNVGPANTTALSLNLDTTFPTKPGDPTAAAGPDINAVENGTFTILVPGINTTGAVAGDAITIFQGASVLATHALSAGEVAGTATFLNVTLTGADGLKSITAKVTDIAGNVGPANTTALSLNLDTTFPTKPGDPTAAAGPDINAAENGTFTILVPGINTTGAVAGDAITIFQGASVLATHALSAGEVAGTATFLNVTLTGADGLKSITAKVTDIAGNVGPANTTALSLNLDTTPPGISIGSPSLAFANNAATVDYLITYTGSSSVTLAVGDVSFSGVTGGVSATIAIVNPGTSTPTVRLTLATGALGTLGISIAAGTAVDAAGNLALAAGPSSTYVVDNTFPTAPGDPTAAAGPDINAAENGTFTILVPGINTTGAVAGDAITIFQGASVLATHALSAGEVAGTATFLNVTLTGADGLKSITAKVTDQAGNVGPANTTALSLNLDTTFPTKPGDPTAAAGPDINAAENGTFTILVPGINTTGAVAGDAITIFQGASVLATHALSAGEVAGTATFLNVTLTGADGLKSITAKVTDIAGNVGPANTTALSLNLDTTFPTKPGNPTAAAGPDINAAENGTFTILVPGINTTGAVTGDAITIFQGASVLATHALSAGEVAGTATFLNITLTGADGLKSITAKVTDIAGNVGPANTTALSLNLDTTFPTASGDPTAAAGPDINAVENGTFTILVPGINTTGAVAGDAITIFQGASVLATHALSAGEVAGTATFLNITLTGADGLKSITAKVTDIAGNVGPANTTPLSLNLDTTAPIISPVGIASSGTSALHAKIGDNVVVSFTVNESLAALPTATIDGQAATVVNTAGLNYTATVTMNASDTQVTPLTFLVSVFDVAGNPKTRNTVTDGSSVIFDKILPFVSSILIGPAPPLKSPAIGTTNGTIAASLPYQVTFSEAVTGVDVTDFFVTAGGGLVTPTVTNVTPVSALIYNVTVSSYTGTGTARLEFASNGSVVDIASNPTSGPFVPGTFVGTYSVTLAEPSNNVTSLTATPVNPYQIRLDWVNPVVGVLPTHFLLLAKESGVGTYAAFSDSNPVTQEENFGDGNAAVSIPFGLTTYTWSISNPVSMHSGTQYDFIVVPYTLPPNVSGDNIDFLSTGTPTISAFTTTANASTLLVGSTTPQATISSLINFGSAPGQLVFSFQLQEDGSTPGIDDAKTVFTDLVFNAGTGSTTIAWSDIIEQAQLKDIVSGLVKNTTNFTGNTITFNGIVGAVGALNDNQLKEYELRLYLKNPMTGVAKESVDGKLFNLQVDNSSFTFAAHSSGIQTVPAQSQSSGSSGFNVVSVVATKLAFSTQPPASALVLSNVVSALTAPDNLLVPVVRAQDANGNTDLNYTSVLTVSNAGPIVMNGIPSNQITPATGVAQFPAGFNYQDSGNGTLSVAGPSVTGAISNAVTVTYSNTSTITAGALVEPLTISSLNTAGPGVPVFDFTINDDNNVVVGTDGSSTRITQITITPEATNQIDWAQAIGAIGGATLTGTGLPISASSITTGGIVFTINPATDGLILDNASRTYTLRIWLSNNIPIPLRNTIDNKKFVFEVTKANVLLSAQSSTINAGEKEDSGAGPVNNAVNVVTTKLVFTQDMTSPLLPNKDINLQQAVPVVEAVDINLNRDVDYNTTNLTVTSALTMSGLPPVSGAGSLQNGIVTFPTTFRYTNVGNGALTVSSAGAPNPTAALSINPVTVQAGSASTITSGTGPGTISSLATNAGAPVTVFSFAINDDPAGTPAAQDDGNNTLITSIKITKAASNTLPNWNEAIQGATLTDGTNTLNVSTITANDITFDLTLPAAGTLGTVLDGTNLPGPVFTGTKTYTLKISLRPALLGALPTSIDGLAFGFEVLTNNVLTSAAGTGILPAQAQNSGADVVTVVATKLDFTILPFATAPAVPNAFPSSWSQFTSFANSLGVEAHDINGNLDLNFGGNVGTFTVANALTTVNNPSGSFTAGRLTFPANFQYHAGNNQDGSLTLTAGPTGAGAAGAVTSTSTPINIISSFESRVKPDPTFTFSTNIGYVAYQEQNGGISPTDITNGNGSFELARILLSDGDADGVAGDADGATTVLNSITIRIADAANASTLGQIKSIALYNSGFAGATELIEHLVTAPEVAAGQVVLSGLSIIAPDDNLVLGVPTPTPISIRVSFKNTGIIDKTLLNVSIVGAALGGGSQFRTGDIPADIAGISGGLSAPLGVNLVNVVATKLDFIAPFPASVAGFNEPFNGGILHARDQFNFLDVDFNAPATLSSAVTTTGTFNFVSGIANLNGMLYNSTGVGTLTVTAPAPLPPTNTVSSANINPSVGGWANVPVSCTTIDVIHVTTSIATGGVITSTNLAGNSTGKVIFGVTFNVPYKIPGEPKLQKFTLSFSNPYTGVLNNMRVFESQSTTYSGGSATDVTLPAIGATLSFPSNKTVDVTFPVASPRDLSLVANSTLTYFLMVDIDPNASGSTPSIQPSLIDGGSGSATNLNILTTTGSSVSSTTGQTYTFASIFPPILISSNPASGQLNVNPNQATLSLQFSVPVWSLDQKVFLTDQTANGTPVQLNAANGQYPLLTGLGLGSPLVFNMPPPGTLIADHVYYVTIAQGNQATSAGIMDENNNVYQGISYPGTLYFKVATTTPPKLLGLLTSPLAQSNPSITFTSTTGAIIDATFDQRGTAHYMILNHTAIPPVVTNAQILAGTHPSGAVASGSFTISQTTPVSQFGVVTPTTPFIPTQTYDVWMYAENDALPTPFATGSPYGGLPTLAAGGVGPTIISGSVPANGTLVALNNPTISICNNSYQILNSPIIITEGTANQFQTTGSQSMNIVLPAGFQFDVTLNGSVPKYGTLQLLGTDFVVGSGKLTFLGNAILKVEFDNNNNLSMDKIIISGLRVLATTSTSGPMFRLGGSAITSIGDSQTIGTLSSFDAPVIAFTNSYSTTLVPAPTNVVTSIPDNANPATLTLTPIPAPPLAGTLFSNGDFGPSSFTGQGVNINVLTLSAVTLDVPFNITVNHTDNNGCVSSNAIQYTVYDHIKALNITDNLLTSGGVTVITNPTNTYCADNDQFVVGKVPQNRPLYGRAGHVRYLDYKNLAPFYLISMTADLPAGGSTGLLTGQIMNGLAWSNLIKTSLPQALLPTHTVGTDVFTDYKFDDAIFSDANFLSGGAIPDPYSNFKSTVTSAATGLPITYYTGGSLGFIELTGNFQSRTNAQVKVPRVQRLEIYLPAIPIVDGSKPSFVDITDPKNPPYSVSGTGPVNNPGTLVYCEAGGLINISARPAAVPGRSSGVFTIVDAISGATLPAAGFTDNTNGTAVLDPSVVSLKNGYKDIKITYTFQDNNSPCPSTSYQIIRITPNPVGGFDKNAVIGNNTPTTTSYCIGNVINFDANSAAPAVPKTTITAAPVTVPATPANTLQSYAWDFGDVNSSSNIVSGVAQSHTFGIPQTYAVTLRAVSNWGCPLVTPYQQNIVVGGIPTVKIKFDGVSTADTFNFASNGSTVSSNDTFASLTWDFGDGTAPFTFTYPTLTPPALDPSTTFQHSYLTAGPGRKVVDLKVTSTIGCVNSLSLSNSALGLNATDNSLARTVVVLPRGTTAAGANAYQQDFESSDGSWQVWYASTPGQPLIFAPGTPATPTPSWKYNPPAGTVIKPDPNGLNGANGAGIGAVGKYWSTYNPTTKKYTGFERSALYSPSFDISPLGTPMMSYSSFVQLESSDGLIVEYSTDNLNIADPLKKWNVLGANIGEGVSWFTDKGIASKPGNQVGNDFGWSGVTNTSWQTSKHTLDEINTTGPLTKVVFRFALASAKAVPTVEGFGIDNMRVGDRTRTILLESFANTANADPSEAIQNSSVAAFPGTSLGTQVIKVNYHVSFPGTDPFNMDNPADPSARALYYNITTTPKSRLDGSIDPTDGPFSVWSNTSYGTRSLQLAQAVITPTATLVNGIVRTQVDIKAVFDLPANTILQVAVVEKTTPLGSLSSAQQAMVKSGETNFVHVLKKMLPTAAGTRFGSILLQGNSKTFGPFDWIPEPTKLYLPANDLRIVTFLQNELTGEVYQVNYADVNDPTPITGLEPLSPDDVLVYPNPANHEMNIRLPGVLLQAASVQMVDQVGHITVTTTIPEGANSKTINTRDLAAGMYILMIETGPGISTRKKVMVVHEE